MHISNLSLTTEKGKINIYQLTIYFNKNTKFTYYYLCFILYDRKYKTIFCHKKIWFDPVRKAINAQSLISAVPLLTDTGVLGCWVFPLARCTPH